MTSGIAGTGRNRKAGRVPVPQISIYVERLRIVPVDLFDKVERSFETTRDTTEYAARRSHASNIKYVLSGIAACDRCGHLLRLTSSTNGYRRIGCTYKLGHTPQCRDSGYSLGALERLALRGLREVVLDPSNFTRFETEARKALDKRGKNEGELRRRLEEEAGDLKTKLDQAMRQTFSHRRLSERREAMLEEMEDRLAELEDRIASLSLRAAPELSPEALPSLREMFEDLEIRSPFLPKNAAEIAVFSTLRRLIASVRVRRISRFVFEATIEYDLGPALGVDVPEVRITKTLRHDAAVETSAIREKRKLNVERLLSQDEFRLSDAELEKLSDVPTFRTLFGMEGLETRRSVVRALLFRGAYNASAAAMRDMLADDAERLGDRLRTFRNSSCVPRFVAVANGMFPDVPIACKAIRDNPPFYMPRIHARLREQKHPFLKLAICRSGKGVERISDDHWQAVTSLRLGMAKKALRTGAGYDPARSATIKKTLEAVAIVVREGQPLGVAAERMGMSRMAVTTTYAFLQREDRLLPIADKLLALEAADRRGGPASG